MADLTARDVEDVHRVGELARRGDPTALAEGDLLAARLYVADSLFLEDPTSGHKSATRLAAHTHYRAKTPTERLAYWIRVDAVLGDFQKNFPPLPNLPNPARALGDWARAVAVVVGCFVLFAVLAVVAAVASRFASRPT